MKRNTRRLIFFLGKGLKAGKRIRYALQTLPGLGPFYAQQICDQFGLGPDMRLGELDAPRLEALSRYVQRFYVTGAELFRLVRKDVAKQTFMGSCRGIRLNLGLPVRGQRTRTNATNAKKLSFFRPKPRKFPNTGKKKANRR